MWSFLNPAVLFGLFAAGIPIILHFLSRRRVKIVEFSSVAFLNTMKQSRLRYVRLKEILLLIIRTLIVAFLVLGFARPTFQGGVGAGNGPSSIVVLIDDSYSMSRQTTSGTLFEIAKSKAMEVLATVSPGDKIAVMPFSLTSDPRYSFFSPDPSYFARLIPEFNSTPDTTAVVTAIGEAVQLLNQSLNLNRELVIISDFGLCGWSSEEAIREALAGFTGDVLFVGMDGEEVNNAYVAGVDYGGRIIQPGVGFDIEATVVNTSGRRIDNLLADLFLDGKRISQTEISLSPSETGKVSLRATVASPGIHHGYVEIGDDELAIDNRRYFAFQVPETVRLLIVGSNNELSNRIRLAISPIGAENSHIKADLKPVSKVLSMGIGDYDAAIFTDYRPSQALAARIQSFVEDGKGVFIIPAAGVGVKEFNDDLTRMNMPVEIDRELRPGSEGVFQLEGLATDHPIFAVYHNLKLSGQTFKLPEVGFHSIYSVNLKGKAQVPATLSGKRPLFVSSDRNGGTIVLSTAPFSENLSDITSSSMFLPMIQRLSEYLAAGTGNFSQGYGIGETIKLNLDRELAAGKLEVVAPTGEIIAVQPRMDAAGNVVIFDFAEQPGHYSLKSGDHEIDAFAVNVDTRESQPGVVAGDLLTAFMPENQADFIIQSDDIGTSLTQFRKGKEYTAASFGIVLFLLALEMAIAGHWRRRKQK